MPIRNRLTIPFIVVSHAIGDEEAVGLMRNGAADYVLKDRMARLGEAVRHALEDGSYVPNTPKRSKTFGSSTRDWRSGSLREPPNSRS